MFAPNDCRVDIGGGEHKPAGLCLIWIEDETGGLRFGQLLMAARVMYALSFRGVVEQTEVRCRRCRIGTRRSV